MQPLSRFTLSPISRRARTLSAIASALLISVATPDALAQNNADDAAKRRRGNPSDENGRRGGSPEDVQARMLSSLRERLEVPDDEEWKVISERLGKLMELRRTSGSGAFGGFALAGRGPQGGSDNSRGGRGPRTGGSPEMTALQSAIRDKLPDAEIKSRLDRVRENRKLNETKLGKAQEDLRAVLSVRQEAVAVVFGLLP
jgi:hypothetical protein